MEIITPESLREDQFVAKYAALLNAMSDDDCEAQSIRLEKLLEEVIRATGYAGSKIWVSDTKDTEDDLCTVGVYKIMEDIEDDECKSGDYLIAHNPSFTSLATDDILRGIIAHEICHIIHNHGFEETEAEKIEHEYMADSFAHSFYPAAVIEGLFWMGNQDDIMDVEFPDHPTLRERIKALEGL